MDGIALELWNKKLLQCRYKRQLEFRARAELSHTSREFSVEPLPSMLFQAGAENLELLVLYWKETFQTSWERQNPANPDTAAGQARGEVETLLTTEQRQIENEVVALGTTRGLGWKPDDLNEGKAHLANVVSMLRAACVTYIADLRAARTEDLEGKKSQILAQRKELWRSRIVTGLLTLIGTLAGVWLATRLDQRRVHENRLFVDQRIAQVMATQRQTQEQLSALHRSNQRLTYWTDKTSRQIDEEIAEARKKLGAEIYDIQTETQKKIGLLINEYVRAGRDGGTELDDRKDSLIKLQDKMIDNAKQRTQKLIDTLEDQKRNVQR